MGHHMPHLGGSWEEGRRRKELITKVESAEGRVSYVVVVSRFRLSLPKATVADWKIPRIASRTPLVDMSGTHNFARLMK